MGAGGGQRERGRASRRWRRQAAGGRAQSAGIRTPTCAPADDARSSQCVDLQKVPPSESRFKTRIHSNSTAWRLEQFSSRLKPKRMGGEGHRRPCRHGARRAAGAGLQARCAARSRRAGITHSFSPRRRRESRRRGRAVLGCSRSSSRRAAPHSRVRRSAALRVHRSAVLNNSIGPLRGIWQQLMAARMAPEPGFCCKDKRLAPCSQLSPTTTRAVVGVGCSVLVATGGCDSCERCKLYAYIYA